MGGHIGHIIQFHAANFLVGFLWSDYTLLWHWRNNLVKLVKKSLNILSYSFSSRKSLVEEHHSSKINVRILPDRCLKSRVLYVKYKALGRCVSSGLSITLTLRSRQLSLTIELSKWKLILFLVVWNTYPGQEPSWTFDLLSCYIDWQSLGNKCISTNRNWRWWSQ